MERKLSDLHAGHVHLVGDYVAVFEPTCRADREALSWGALKVASNADFDVEIVLLLVGIAEVPVDASKLEGVFTLSVGFDDEGEVKQAKEERVQLLGAQEDSAEPLSSAEEPFALVALSVERAIVTRKVCAG